MYELIVFNHGGVGGGGDDNTPCACTDVECYSTGLGWGGMITFLALAHRNTGLGWGVDDNVPCACTKVGCYATGLGSGGG